MLVDWDVSGLAPDECHLAGKRAIGGCDLTRRFTKQSRDIVDAWILAGQRFKISSAFQDLSEQSFQAAHSMTFVRHRVLLNGEGNFTFDNPDCESKNGARSQVVFLYQ